MFSKLFKNISLLLALDIFAFGLSILHMFGRMGCYMARCCHGKETSLAIGIIFPTGGLAPAGVKLYNSFYVKSYK